MWINSNDKQTSDDVERKDSFAEQEQRNFNIKCIKDFKNKPEELAKVKSRMQNDIEFSDELRSSISKALRANNRQVSLNPELKKDLERIKENLFKN